MCAIEDLLSVFSYARAGSPSRSAYSQLIQKPPSK
jgi:hypothetical protein